MLSSSTDSAAVSGSGCDRTVSLALPPRRPATASLIAPAQRRCPAACHHVQEPASSASRCRSSGRGCCSPRPGRGLPSCAGQPLPAAQPPLGLGRAPVRAGRTCGADMLCMRVTGGSAWNLATMRCSVRPSGVKPSRAAPASEPKLLRGPLWHWCPGQLPRMLLCPSTAGGGQQLHDIIPAGRPARPPGSSPEAASAAAALLRPAAEVSSPAGNAAAASSWMMVSLNTRAA